MVTSIYFWRSGDYLFKKLVNEPTKVNKVTEKLTILGTPEWLYQQSLM